MFLLSGCLSTWANRTRFTATVKGVPVSCESVIFLKDGKIEQNGFCQFEIMEGGNIYRCTLAVHSLKKDVDILTDCEVIFQKKLQLPQ